MYVYIYICIEGERERDLGGADEAVALGLVEGLYLPHEAPGAEVVQYIRIILTK